MERRCEGEYASVRRRGRKMRGGGGKKSRRMSKVDVLGRAERVSRFLEEDIE